MNFITCNRIWALLIVIELEPVNGILTVLHYWYIKVGKTFSFGNGRLDDGKALAELGFQVRGLCFYYLYINQSYIPFQFLTRLFCVDWRLLGCGDIVKKSSSLSDLIFRSLIFRSNFGIKWCAYWCFNMMRTPLIVL